MKTTALTAGSAIVAQWREQRIGPNSRHIPVAIRIGAVQPFERLVILASPGVDLPDPVRPVLWLRPDQLIQDLLRVLETRGAGLGFMYGLSQISAQSFEEEPDVHIPTTDVRELTLTRYTQPEPELSLLLERLKFTLPPQPPPKITAAQATSAAVPFQCCER
jgi:hypothetical protein